MEVSLCTLQRNFNPPYMSPTNGGAELKDFVKKNYPDSKADMCSVFIEKNKNYTISNGFQAMITMHAWMYLQSYEKLRPKLRSMSIINMIHLGTRAFEDIGGEVVQTTSFIFRNTALNRYAGVYCRLIKAGSQNEKKNWFLSGKYRYTASQNEFSNIPGEPIAYWLCENALKAFKNDSMGDVALLCQGLTTTNNDLYVRHWYEVSNCKIGFGFHNTKQASESGKKWFPFNKGGSFRKWYGNNDLVVNYQNDGEAIKKDVLKKYPYLKTPDFVVKNSKTYFHGGLTWSALSNVFSIRQFPDGAICADKGQGLFAETDILQYSAALLNSKIGGYFLQVISPTLDFNCGYVRKVPFISDKNRTLLIDRIVSECVSDAKSDWDLFETSWDFKHHPLIGSGNKLSECFLKWQNECNNRFDRLKLNEEELNHMFIDIYGLQDELTPEEDDKDVTVRKADLGRDIRSFISYAVGCMFGRYSLDVDGLAYAGGDWDSSKYRTFIPDSDNIIPITDEEYFEDDIVGLFCGWLKKVYGADTLEENLDFIAKALGNKGSTSRDVIRNYFLNDFFKDHCNTYSVTGSGKRPIYWLFDSGKQNGFKALIYLHRYDQDTVGRVRTDYLHKTQKAIEQAMAGAQYTLENSRSGSEKSKATKRISKYTKQLAEIQLYDEAIAHVANQRIPLDLDDGVKVNYAKFQGVEVSREGMKTVKVDLLAKI